MSFVVYTLYINQEVFYTAHDRSEFIFGTPFFDKLMQKPFGLMQYAGAWLTLFFHKPAIGSSICCLSAHVGGRSRLLDLYLNDQRLLVLAVCRLSGDATASMGSTPDTA